MAMNTGLERFWRANDITHAMIYLCIINIMNRKNSRAYAKPPSEQLYPHTPDSTVTPADTWYATTVETSTLDSPWSYRATYFCLLNCAISIW